MRRPSLVTRWFKKPTARRTPAKPTLLRPPVQHAVRPARQVFASAAELPRPRAGTVRVYRGTGRPDRLQVSHSMRGRPPGEIPRGDQSFFGPFEGTRLASRHAFGADDVASDAVSTTTDLNTARTYALSNRGAVLVYDVPRAIFERLPPGDRAIGEVIFRHSIPDEFAIGILSVR